MVQDYYRVTRGAFAFLTVIALISIGIIKMWWGTKTIVFQEQTIIFLETENFDYIQFAPSTSSVVITAVSLQPFVLEVDGKMYVSEKEGNGLSETIFLKGNIQKIKLKFATEVVKVGVESEKETDSKITIPRPIRPWITLVVLIWLILSFFLLS